MGRARALEQMREWVEAERVRTCSGQKTPQDPHVEAELTINLQEPPNINPVPF